ncbi:hypothetical protein P3T39_003731 [Kitasatospora sp. GP82]|nr:hypothetical protein [Kitasatospora sp. GP82]
MPEQTRHLLNAERLALLKPTAFVVNTARGALIDQDALADALEAGALAGAGLDVFDPEPPTDGLRLLRAPGVVLSPARRRGDPGDRRPDRAGRRTERDRAPGGASAARRRLLSGTPPGPAAEPARRPGPDSLRPAVRRGDGLGRRRPEGCVCVDSTDPAVPRTPHRER